MFVQSIAPSARLVRAFNMFNAIYVRSDSLPPMKSIEILQTSLLGQVQWANGNKTALANLATSWDFCPASPGQHRLEARGPSGCSSSTQSWVAVSWPYLDGISLVSVIKGDRSWCEFHSQHADAWEHIQMCVITVIYIRVLSNPYNVAVRLSHMQTCQAIIDFSRQLIQTIPDVFEGFRRVVVDFVWFCDILSRPVVGFATLRCVPHEALLNGSGTSWSSWRSLWVEASEVFSYQQNRINWLNTH
jgi:hypothetical protein